ncbi:MAG TPA: SurA N-terminal domain-containing protein [Brumimicrobium sp.]|nr:SurA N-terminal domain-containing protein [Brumimicrobium sp.]
MAVLNKIRQRSVFLILIIALALFSFVLADVIQNGGFSSQKSQTTVATINGVDISRDEFSTKVDNMLQNLGTNATTAQAMNLAWNNELRSVLLQQQYEKVGVGAESAQINAALAQAFATNPQFQNEAGRFDYAKLQQYIATLKSADPQQYAQWVNYENNVAKNVKEQTYLNMVKGGMIATTLEGEMEFLSENNNVSIQYVQVPYSSIADETITVTESEISDYIKNNPEQFKSEASVDIQYVLFSELPSEDDNNEVIEELNALLVERSSYNSASQTTDTLPAFKDVTDHQEFVAIHSEMPYDNRWMFKHQLPAEQANSIFELEVGEVHGPYKIQNRFALSKLVAEKQLADSIKVSHILISYQGTELPGDITRSKEEANQLADSLLAVVKRDKTKFAELAIQFSDDPSALQNSGDLGFLSPGDTVEEIDEFITDNNVGERAIVETPFGFHIVSIDEKRNEQRAVKVATITKTVFPSDATTSKLFADATRFESQAAESDFVDLANELSYEVRPVNNIQELQENIPGIGNNRTIVTWAFEKDSKPGDIKRFNVTNGYAIVQLTAKNKKGLMSVAEASATVTPILRNQKKAAQIRQSISGTTLEDIAQEKNVQVKTASALNLKSPTIADAGTEPKVVGTALGLKAGELSDFIDGEKGVYKVKVTAINKAPERTNFDTFKNTIKTSRTNAVVNGVFTSLKNKAEIDDRRANFY